MSIFSTILFFFFLVSSSMNRIPLCRPMAMTDVKSLCRASIQACLWISILCLPYSGRFKSSRTKYETEHDIRRYKTAYNWVPVAVVIEEPRTISPTPSPKLEDHQLSNVSLSPKRYRAKLGSRKLSGRPASNPSITSLHSAASLQSASEIASQDLTPPSHPKHHHQTSQILSQVRDWLHHEKVRASKRKSKAHAGHAKHASATGLVKSLADHAHSEAPVIALAITGGTPRMYLKRV